YTSNIPSMIERQCLAQSPWVGLYRPLGLRIWSEIDKNGRVIAWNMDGDYLRDTITIWMDGRPHPSANALHPSAGFTTGKWEGDTLTARRLTSRPRGYGGASASPAATSRRSPSTLRCTTIC